MSRDRSCDPIPRIPELQPPRHGVEQVAPARRSKGSASTGISSAAKRPPGRCRKRCGRSSAIARNFSGGSRLSDATVAALDASAALHCAVLDGVGQAARGQRGGAAVPVAPSRSAGDPRHCRRHDTRELPSGFALRTLRGRHHHRPPGHRARPRSARQRRWQEPWPRQGDCRPHRHRHRRSPPPRRADAPSGATDSGARSRASSSCSRSRPRAAPSTRGNSSRPTRHCSTLRSSVPPRSSTWRWRKPRNTTCRAPRRSRFSAMPRACSTTWRSHGRPTPELRYRRAWMLIQFARNYQILGDTGKQYARANEAHRLLVGLAAEKPNDIDLSARPVGCVQRDRRRAGGAGQPGARR